MSDKKGYGLRIRHARSQRGWSQDHLAHLIRTETDRHTKDYISDVELEKIVPSDQVCYKLIRAFSEAPGDSVFDGDALLQEVRAARAERLAARDARAMARNRERWERALKTGGLTGLGSSSAQKADDQEALSKTDSHPAAQDEGEPDRLKDLAHRLLDKSLSDPKKRDAILIVLKALAQDAPH